MPENIFDLRAGLDLISRNKVDFLEGGSRYGLIKNAVPDIFYFNFSPEFLIAIYSYVKVPTVLCLFNVTLRFNGMSHQAQ